MVDTTTLRVLAAAAGDTSATRQDVEDALIETADLFDTIEDIVETFALNNFYDALVSNYTSSTAAIIPQTSHTFVVPFGEVWVLTYTACINFSHSVTSQRVQFRVAENGVDQMRMDQLSHNANTAGTTETVTLSLSKELTAASYTFATRWASASGTSYTLSRYTSLVGVRKS